MTQDDPTGNILRGVLHQHQH